VRACVRVTLRTCVHVLSAGVCCVHECMSVYVRVCVDAQKCVCAYMHACVYAGACVIECAIRFSYPFCFRSLETVEILVQYSKQVQADGDGGDCPWNFGAGKHYGFPTSLVWACVRVCTVYLCLRACASACVYMCTSSV